MNPKMVVLDLDGTTLNNKKEIEPELASYLQILRTKGVLVCIATGRTIFEMQLSLPKEFEVDGFINSNGMSITWNNVEINKFSIPPKTVKELIDCAIKQEIHHEIHYHDGHTAAKISPLRERAHELTVHGYMNPTWSEEISTDHVEKILFFKGEPEAITLWLEKLHEMEQYLSFTAALSSPDLIDISGKSITKATGTNVILDHVGLEFYDIIAFGDGGNDIPLFEKAGRAVAMQNSPDWVKAKATEVTKFTNDEQGLLKHLQSIYGEFN